MRGFIDYLESQGMFGEAIWHFKVEETPMGFVATCVFNNQDAYTQYLLHTGAWDEEAGRNQTIGTFGTHTYQVYMQAIGFDNDLRSLDLDSIANDVVIGSPNLAIYGEPFFGLVEEETFSVRFEEIAAVCFAADLAAAYYNYDTWKSASNDYWTTVYIAEFGVGVLGLLALGGQLIMGGELLLAYTLLHTFFELGILGLIFLAESDNSNITNAATIAGYAAAFAGFVLGAGSQVYFRILSDDSEKKQQALDF